MDQKTESSISQLLRRARSGDQTALGRLFQAYRSYLNLLARLQIDHRIKTKVSPSDVVQETFLLAYGGFAKFGGDTEAELVAWLRKILANRLTSIIREFNSDKRDVMLEQRLKQAVDQSSEALAGQFDDRRPGPCESMSQHEQAVLLANAIDRLEPHYREVVVLRNFQRLSFAEIGERMERTVDSVKSIWARAVCRLREELDVE